MDDLPKIEFNANLKIDNATAREIIGEWVKQHYGVNTMIQNVHFFRDDEDTEVEFDYAHVCLTRENVMENVKFAERAIKDRGIFDTQGAND